MKIKVVLAMACCVVGLECVSGKVVSLSRLVASSPRLEGAPLPDGPVSRTGARENDHDDDVGGCVDDSSFCVFSEC